ncbi:MAG: phosphoribosyltransferase family protein [Synergistaceae bacterium]|jgi:orotate phosphoribosyltransferase|nr:phosphoribosyltransferase family protein [Synergistaceae bacterium]
MTKDNGFPEFLSAALRDSPQAKRPVLICNKLLAKHVPSSPRAALDYFRRLGVLAAKTCRGEKVLVVGFAETATAVGAAAAAEIPGAVYCHTTRELLPRDRLVVEFLEEHSHAVNQALYLRPELWRRYDRIVFVEDEITTGKTILNFLRALREKEEIAQGVTVATLVFNACDESVFSAFNAQSCSLTRLDGFLSKPMPIPVSTGSPEPAPLSPEPPLNFSVLGPPDPRLGVGAEEYRAGCAALAREAAARIGGDDLRGKRVLVLGTEECMYPALVLGAEIEGIAASVRSHSTTRTPIVPQDSEGYPIQTRYSFPSLYDRGRTTYLYNVGIYDTVVIVTDALTGPGADSLVALLRARGNKKIYFVRAANAETLSEEALIDGEGPKAPGAWGGAPQRG